MANKIWLAIKQIFYLDLRSMALARVVFGLIVLYDFLARMPYLRDFYTDEGLLTRQNFSSILDHGHNWTLFMFSGRYDFVLLMYCLMLIIFVFFILGFKQRIVSILLYIFLVSINNRNWMINNSGDDLYRVMSFIFIFLPTHHYFSIDAALSRNKQTNIDHQYISPWTFVLICQLAFVYVFSFYFKTGAHWRSDFNALFFVLNLDAYTQFYAHYLTQFPKLLQVLTFVVIGMEGFGSYILLLSPLSPRREIFRYLIVCLFLSFHIGLIILMKIGSFPWTCLAFWLMLIPTHFWQWLDSRRTCNLGTIYYDGDCGFCKKGVLLIKHFLFLKNVQVFHDSVSVEASTNLNKFNSWVYQDSEGNYFYYFAAFTNILKNHFIWGSFYKFFKIKLVSRIGHQVYLKISTNRKFMSKISKFLTYTDFNFNVGMNSKRLVIVSSLLASFYLLMAVTWNLDTLQIRYKWSYRRHIIKATNWLNLFQYWGMFSPSIKTDDGFFIADGTLINGEKVELINNLPFVDTTPPACISCEYPIKEWKKFYSNLTHKKHYQNFYGDYLCNRWNRRKERIIDKALKEFKLYYIYHFTQGPGLEKSKYYHKLVMQKVCL